MVEVMKKKRRKKKVIKSTQKQKQKQTVSQVVKINIGDTKRKPIPRTRASTQKPQVIYQPQAIPIAPTIANEEIKFKLNKLDQVLAQALMQKTSEPHQRTANLAGQAAIRRAEGEQGTLVQTESQTEAPVLTTSFNLAPVNIMEKADFEAIMTPEPIMSAMKKAEVSGGGGEPSPKRRGRPPGVKNKPKGEPAEISAVAMPVSTMSNVLPTTASPVVQGRVPRGRGAEDRSSQRISAFLPHNREAEAQLLAMRTLRTQRLAELKKQRQSSV